MKIKTGSYTGDGSASQAITGIGFQPDVVLIKRSGASNGVIRSSTVAGNLTKDVFASAAMFAGGILSLGADGFTVGPDARVNTAANTYFYLALQAAASDLKVGTYIGDGIDDRNITGVGFQPDVVIVYQEASFFPVWRSSDVPGDLTLTFGTNAPADNRIQMFQADGFQVGNATTVNANLVTHHYIAVKKAAGLLNTLTYAGNATDNRDLTGLGFLPDFVTIRGGGTTTVQGAVRYGAEVGDNSMVWDSAEGVNRIQALQADGFQIGTSTAVNVSGVTYYAFALKTGAPPPPPTPAAPRVHLMLKRKHWIQRDTAAPFL